VRTFGELPPVELTSLEFDCNDVAEGFVKELYWDSQSAHGGTGLGVSIGHVRGPTLDGAVMALYSCHKIICS
jgi:hypothetical protein